MSAPEKITGVAIKSNGRVWALPAPHWHGHIYALAAFTNQDAAPAAIEGFMTDTGRFVNRIEAREIAIASQHPIRRALTSPALYSEDLW